MSRRGMRLFYSGKKFLACLGVFKCLFGVGRRLGYVVLSVYGEIIH